MKKKRYKNSIWRREKNGTAQDKGKKSNIRGSNLRRKEYSNLWGCCDISDFFALLEQTSHFCAEFPSYD